MSQWYSVLKTWRYPRIIKLQEPETTYKRSLQLECFSHKAPKAWFYRPTLLLDLNEYLYLFSINVMVTCLSDHVKGLKWDSTDDEVSRFVCEPCLASKAHRLPFKIANFQASSWLELVYSDVLLFPAPFPGKAYLVTFIGGYSRNFGDTQSWTKVMCSKHSKTGN